jgi:hypothetical protein
MVNTIKLLLVFVMLIVNSIFSAAGAFHPLPAINASEPETVAADVKLFVPLVITDAPPTVFGIENITYEPQEVMDLANKSGVHWVRVNALIWSDVEPAEGQRNWAAVSSIETQLKTLANSGKETILIIRRTPEWARQVASSPCGPVKSQKYGALANFMRDVVKRYSAPPYNVRYFELWNEPDAAVNNIDDVYGCWGDVNDTTYYGGRTYGKVLKQVYPKVKEANGNAKLVIGGLLMDCDPVNPPAGKNCTMSRYFEGILAEGAGSYFDVVSFHAYDYYYGALGDFRNENWHSAWNTTGPVLIAKTEFLKSILTKYNITGKTLLCTEIAIVCQDNCDNTFQQTKAYYVVQAYTTSIVEGLQGGIWYTLVDRWRESGLASKTYTPHPAFNAFKFARLELGNAQSGHDVSEGQMRIYQIDTFKGRILVAWSKDGASHTLNLSETPYAAYDLYGNSIPVSQSMQVTLAPIYIELDPP